MAAPYCEPVVPRGGPVSAPDQAQAGLGLPRTRRLQLAREFAATLRGRQRWRDEYFSLAAQPGAVGARLGITVSKRSARRAVDRNRIKRQIRESFRGHWTTLPFWDVVVMAQGPAAVATSAELRQSLARHWLKLQQRCASSS